MTLEQTEACVFDKLSTCQLPLGDYLLTRSQLLAVIGMVHVAGEANALRQSIANSNKVMECAV